jgi:putative methyltransferase (TIGR04325 family)
MSTLRNLLKGCTPPAVWRAARRLLGPQPAFKGNYKSWHEACNDSTGYGSAEIASRVLAATLKVRAGEACYERDSVLFDTPSPRYPLVAELLAAASGLGNRLSVMDFGGALGSLYHQHRAYLENIVELKWGVVEQKTLADAGRAHCTDEHLQFYDSIEACVAGMHPDIAVASCVLQYLPEPWVALRQLLGAAPATIIDRLPLIDADTDRLTVQTVDDKIYPASYPAWFFSRSRFMAALDENGYRAVNEFESIDTVELDQLPLRTIGMVIRKKKAA